MNNFDNNNVVLDDLGMNSCIIPIEDDDDVMMTGLGSPNEGSEVSHQQTISEQREEEESIPPPEAFPALLNWSVEQLRQPAVASEVASTEVIDADIIVIPSASEAELEEAKLEAVEHRARQALRRALSAAREDAREAERQAEAARQAFDQMRYEEEDRRDREMLTQEAINECDEVSEPFVWWVHRARERFFLERLSL